MGAMKDLTMDIIAYENGEMPYQEMLVFFQKLVDSGFAWQLQGHYGRTAKDLIEQGLITPKERSN
jgi:hypothetical protein